MQDLPLKFYWTSNFQRKVVCLIVLDFDWERIVEFIGRYLVRWGKSSSARCLDIKVFTTSSICTWRLPCAIGNACRLLLMFTVFVFVYPSPHHLVWLIDWRGGARRPGYLDRSMCDNKSEQVVLCCRCDNSAVTSSSCPPRGPTLAPDLRRHTSHRSAAIPHVRITSKHFPIIQLVQFWFFFYSFGFNFVAFSLCVMALNILSTCTHNLITVLGDVSSKAVLNK